MSDFWDHVFIIRTHANIKDEDFEDDKNKIKDSIIKSIEMEDFKDFKDFMISKQINIPTKIEEFYVDCRENKKERTQKNNKEEFDNIFNAIEGCHYMFKNIKVEDKEDVIDNNSVKYPIVRTTRFISYITHSDQIINESFILKEDEKCNYPVERTEERKEEIETRSHCGKIEINYDCYETKIYNINGKSVRGSELYKGSKWIKQKK